MDIEIEGTISKIDIISDPVDPTRIHDALGVTTGSRMHSSIGYSPDITLKDSTASIDGYWLEQAPVFQFDTFSVNTGCEFNIYKRNDPPRGSIFCGSSVGGYLSHNNGWHSNIQGMSGIWFKNRTGVNYTLSTLPTILNSHNFKMEFFFGAFTLGGDHEGPLVNISGVIKVDAIRITTPSRSAP